MNFDARDAREDKSPFVSGKSRQPLFSRPVLRPGERVHRRRRGPLSDDLQQPLRQDGGGGGVLAGDQISVLHHVRLPDLAAAEVDADLLLELGLEEPCAHGSHSDRRFLFIGEAGHPVAFERRDAVDPGGEHRSRTVAYDEERVARGELGGQQPSDVRIEGQVNGSVAVGQLPQLVLVEMSSHAAGHITKTRLPQHCVVE